MKLLFNNKKIFLLSLSILLFVTDIYSQEKRPLTPEDYKLWSTLQSNGAITSDSKWTSYRVVHENLKDTLYLKNIVSGKRYSYPLGTSYDFSSDNNWFACIKVDTLALMDLHTGNKYNLAGMAGFTFTADSRYLLCYNNLIEKTLWLRDLKTSAMRTISGVREYSLNPDKNILAIVIAGKSIDSDTVKIISLRTGLHTTIMASKKGSHYSKLTWNKLGRTLAFYEQYSKDLLKPVERIYICRNIEKKSEIKILDPLKYNTFPKNGHIALERTLYVSDDSKQIFLYLNNDTKNNDINPAKDKNTIQIWNTEDKEVPPPLDPEPLKSQWYVWWIDTDNILAVEDNQYPNVILTGDQKKALVYNPREYLPQHKYVSDYIDVYIKDLVTGTIKLLIKKQINEFRHVLVSPGGKYVTYFKDKNWWVYDIKKDTHKCITKGLDIPFENIDYDWAGSKPPYGNPGWLDNDSKLIIHDQFDIWLMSSDGSKRVKITDGQKANISYRIYDSGYFTLIKDSFSGFIADAFSAKEGILINSLNNSTLKEGFYYWDEKSGLVEMLQKDRELYPLNLHGNKKPFLFLESDFDVAPRLMLLKPSGEQQLIYQSNPQQKEFHWGKSELIYYLNTDGKQLKGALLYPAGYVPGKKYPMIVYIYEKYSSYYHRYFPPSQNLRDGFNPTNYTSEGYFVLYPDIAYEVNNPGISATNCVVAAVNKVLEKDLVDKNNIGLMGFSYGGYETTFIISQTDLFKTAIAGAPVVDIVDFYLSLGGYGQSNIWRFENQQFRIQSPFYGSDFQRNSPIANVQNINTPLLLFTGTKDTQVEWTQSRKLQIALWRLHKKSTLLIYPGENHGLDKDINQKDITLRVKNWFDYYLKQSAAAKWMITK